MLIALVLSHRMGMQPTSTKRSFNCCFIHNTCAQHAAAATYSASAVDRATEFCFLDAHDTKQGPRKLAIPEVLIMKRVLGWFGNNPDVNQNMGILRDKMKSLIAREADVLEEIENVELHPGKKQRTEVAHWLAVVEERKAEFQSIEKEGEGQNQGLTSSQSPLIYRIKKLTKGAEELFQQGRFPNGLVLNDHRSLKLQVAGMVGEMFHKTFETILGWLKCPLPFVIGVYGMGGVGKTTLLKHIHNHLLADSEVGEFVHWVTVSQDCSLYKLQQKISCAIGVKLSAEKDEAGRAAILNHALQRMGKSVLILDDVWESFMVDEVGIPSGSNSCKIILSCRSLEVCRKMGSGKFYVQAKALSTNDAFKLFVDTIQHYEEMATEVKHVAALVAEECCGLPLAIVTMAVAMRGVLSRHEWQNALDELRSPNKGQSDMKDKVFSSLDFSYDRLNNEMLQSCFLSCVLYPKDYDILRGELINMWIAEGLFDAMQNREEKVNKGHTILNKLENSCLLEHVALFLGVKYVKMHDLIRDMAIIITQSHPRFMAKSGLLLNEIPDEELWAEDLVKVSLGHNRITQIPSDMSPRCSKLSVLMLSYNPLNEIPESFFVNMRALTFVDLSQTLIKRLPESVCDLENLRALMLSDCVSLEYVPSVEKLTKLRVLDLPVNLKKAPRGMENLKRLEKLTCCRWDISDWTYFKRLTQPWAWRKLYCYQFLLSGQPDEPCSWVSDPCFLYDENYDKKVVVSCVELGQKQPATLGDVLPSLCGATEVKWLEIERCRGLGYISSAPHQDSSICDLLDTLEFLTLELLPELQGITQLGGIETETVFPSTRSGGVVFSHLKELCITACPKLRVVFQVHLLQQHQPLLPNLEHLTLGTCDELEVVFESPIRVIDTTILSLPKLKKLRLVYLPKLRSIYRGVFLCSSPDQISIYQCPRLQILPLSKPVICDASSSTLASIPTQTQDPEWWEALHRNYPEDELALSSFINQVRHIKERRILGYVLPSLGCATQLKELMIESCTGFEFVLWEQQHDIIFPQLERLHLEDLPDLQGIIKLGRSETEALLPSPIHRSTFSHLKWLYLHKCPNMKVVFPVNLLQQIPLLPNLFTISLSDCEELEEIFEESPRPSNARGTNFILALRKLKHLNLERLPKLGRVYRGVLVCSSLKSIITQECPMLQRLALSRPVICDASPSTLTSIPTHTGDPEWWQPLWQYYPDDAIRLSDLVHQFHQNYEQMTSYSEIVSWYVAATPSKLGYAYTSLRSLIFNCCDEMREMFPLEVLKHQQPLLPNLELLRVEECQNVEVIFASPVGGTKSPILSLPKLGWLDLKNLPKLRRIYRGMLICSSLEWITINYCPNLEKMVPLSKPLICDASPETLVYSIPTFDENPDWWQPLMEDYLHDAGLLSNLVNQFQSSIFIHSSPSPLL